MKTKEQLAREHSQVMEHLATIPWDKAMNEITEYIKDNR